MKRGEIWTLHADGYASKPRPVVIVQSDAVDRFDSVITCLLTSYDSSDIATRVRLEPSPENGLNKVSYVMTDKIVTVDRKLLGYQVGVVDDAAMANIGRQLMRVLGLL